MIVNRKVHQGWRRIDDRTWKVLVDVHGFHRRHDELADAIKRTTATAMVMARPGTDSLAHMVGGARIQKIARSTLGWCGG